MILASLSLALPTTPLGWAVFVLIALGALHLIRFAGQLLIVLGALAVVVAVVTIDGFAAVAKRAGRPRAPRGSV